MALAGIAAQRRDASSLARMQKRLETMHVDMSDWQKFVDADVAFHLEIGAAAHNTVLSGILGSLGSLLEAWIARVLQAAGDSELFHAQHMPIFIAIEAGDRPAAELAMGAHIDSVTERLINSPMPTRLERARVTAQ